MSFNSASKILSEGVGVYKNTGLSSVMFKNNIYVFYSGVGKDGAWYGVGPGASPRAAQWTGPSSCRNSGATIMSGNRTVAGNANWINLWHYFYHGSPSAIPREAVSLLALATLAFNLNYRISINTDSQMRFSPRLIFRRIPPNKG
ncbi:hypothetical protein Focb16_v002428 [Fusarium oxysporum f. sp. cubense]|uniref:Uncharacterized protein n=1 Tax=Fusarium oxysporum f. sp. cubense TaxID=61366 RepID=A0A559L6I8_FUSOC|nr:hypothetical protein Focb16_v002428 [Fusarium oxysporum f. sp. cubense]